LSKERSVYRTVFLQPLIPAFRISELIFEKRCNAFSFDPSPYLHRKRVKKEAKMDIIERFFQHAEQSFFLWIISKKIGVKAAALRELRKNCK
jgi:hypothetical protein